MENKEMYCNFLKERVGIKHQSTINRYVKTVNALENELALNFSQCKVEKLENLLRQNFGKTKICNNIVDEGGYKQASFASYINFRKWESEKNLKWNEENKNSEKEESNKYDFPEWSEDEDIKWPEIEDEENEDEIYDKNWEDGEEKFEEEENDATNIVAQLKKYGFNYVYSFSELVKNKQSNYKEILKEYVHAGVYVLVDVAKNKVLYVGRTGRSLKERIGDYLFCLSPKWCQSNIKINKYVKESTNNIDLHFFQQRDLESELIKWYEPQLNDRLNKSKNKLNKSKIKS